MHVLVVDSDKIISSQVVQALKMAGHDTTVAISAESGVQSIDEFTPDCIVLELALGGHNGLEFIYELRSYADMMHIPIVLYTYVSPHDFTSDEVVHAKLGIVAYLQKTTSTLQQLVLAVERSVNKAVE